MNSFSLKGRIETDANGTQQLVDFYNYASNFNNCWFNLDLNNLSWIDANLTAELFLYCHLLKTKNRIKFFIDYYSLRNDLNVLHRNGFAYYAVQNKEKFKPDDIRDSVIPLKAFKIDAVDDFVDYIEKSFLKQRGLEKINFETKEKIKDSYFEIFDNVGIHANTEMPIFCCGQYFPSSAMLKFTLLDFGDGFLKKIAKYTNNEVNRASDAITWAIKGGSTKTGNIKGGTGLKTIMNFCSKYGGDICIVSDGCFWSFQGSTKSITTHKIKNYLKGATIHLTFRQLNK